MTTVTVLPDRDHRHCAVFTVTAIAFTIMVTVFTVPPTVVTVMRCRFAAMRCAVGGEGS